MPEQLAAAVLAAANNPGAPPAVEPAALATAASAEEDLVPGADESDDAEYEAQPDDDVEVGPIDPPQGFFDGREVICRMPWCVTPRSMLWLS